VKLRRALRTIVFHRSGFSCAIVAVYAGAWLAASLPSAAPSQAAIRLAVASLAVVLLPGYTVMTALGWFRGAGAGREQIPLAFGVGYGIVTALAAAGAVLHLSLTQTLALLSIGTIAMALMPARSGAAVEAQPRGSRLSAAVIVATGLVVACAWILEPPVTGEETVELISIRKIVESPSISLDGIMAEPNAIPTYLIAPYYFFVALVSKAAGVSMFVAYLKLRALYAGLAMLTLAALTGRLFPEFGSRLPDVVALGVVALFVADPDPWTWPVSIFPLVRRGAFTAGVLAPVFMLALLVYVTRPSSGRRAIAEWLAPGMMLLSLLTTHAMEIIYAGFFAVAVAAGRLAISKSTVAWRRLAGFGASAAVAAVAFRAIHARLVTHVYAFDQGAQAQALANLRAELASGLSSLAGISDAGRYLVSVSGGVVPYAVLGIVVTPLLIQFERQGGTVVWMAVLTPLAVYCSSKLFVVLQLVTSSEILFVFSYFALWGTVSFIVVVFMGLNAVMERVQRAASGSSGIVRAVLLVSAAAGIGWLVAAPLLRSVASFLVARPLAVPWIAAAGGVVALSVRRGSRADDRWQPAPFATLACVALVGGIAVGFRGFPGQLEGSRREPLTRKIAEHWRQPSVLDWQAYYPLLASSTAPTIDLPAAVVDDLNRLLPPLQTLIADPMHSFALPVVLNQHIVNPGHVISTSLTYFERYARLDATGRRAHPIFNDSKRLTPEERRFLDEFGVNYIVVNPRYCRVLREKFEADSGRFEKIYERDGFFVYRYVPATVGAR
jgi:hypothetical protein